MDLGRFTDRINEIKDVAEQNDNKISRRMVYDILKNKNTEIVNDDIEEICYYLIDEGIFISESDDEGYDSAITENAFIPADVNIGMKNVSLDAMVKRLDYNEIDLNPDFQRRPDLWSEEQKSRLIESLMLRIPLPAFYFDASNDDKWIVIDGLQRLSAIRGFILGGKQLEGLQYLTEFNGCTYEELPRQYIRRIIETQLVIYTVEKGTPQNVIFNIFQRLNTGGLVLTSQEIRHALNQGPIIKTISEMALCDEFKRATDYSIKTARMLDCEYATRYIAFTHLDISEYNGNIDEFLNSALLYGNRCEEKERSEIKERFKRDLNYCYKIFGKYSFRRIKVDGTRGPINKALFECFLANITELNDEILNKLLEHRELIQEKYFDLTRSEYANYLKSGDKYTVNRRLQMTKDFFEEIQNAK